MWRAAGGQGKTATLVLRRGRGDPRGEQVMEKGSEQLAFHVINPGVFGPARVTAAERASLAPGPEVIAS